MADPDKEQKTSPLGRFIQTYHSFLSTFVIGAEMTRLRLAERAVETLLSSNPRNVLAVLNKVNFGRNKYYYSRYYGQHYYTYYSQDVAAAS